MFFDNNFLFFVTVMATLDDSRRSSGADPGFQVRGDALKKNCAERREALKFLGYFV
jgi:hypothetical protein